MMPVGVKSSLFERKIAPDTQNFKFGQIDHVYSDIKSALGAGSFGVVFGTTDRKTGQRVAVKMQVLRPDWRMRMHEIRSEPGWARLAEQEGWNGIVGATRTFVHRAFGVTVRKESAADRSGATWTRDALEFWTAVRDRLSAQTRCDREIGDVFVMEMAMAEHSLQARFKTWGYNSRTHSAGISDHELVAKWFGQICLCLEQLHVHDVMHRDIKPSNILIFEDGSRTHARLSDFGLLTGTTVPLTEAAGTLYYRSPEMLRCVAYEKPHDVWSTGVVFLEMFCGRVAIFKEDTEDKVIDNIRTVYAFVPAGHSTEVADDGRRRRCASALDSRGVRRNLRWIML